MKVNVCKRDLVKDFILVHCLLLCHINVNEHSCGPQLKIRKKKVMKPKDTLSNKKHFY